MLAGQLRAGHPGFVGQGNVAHAIYPVAGDAVPGREGQQIIIFIVLAQTVGAGGVGPVPVFPHAVQTPVEVAEADLPVLGNGLLNGVHRIVDRLIHALDPPGDVYVPLHQLGVLGAAQGAQLFNQGAGLLLCQEAAGLHGVDQQLQLRQLKALGGHIVPSAPSGLAQDVHAEILQGGNVGIDGLAVAVDAVPLQHVDQLTRSHRLIPVGVFLQVIQNI